MPKKYLVVNPFGIGDVLFTLSLVEELRRQEPQAFIGFVCNERTAELVRMDTSIDRTLVFNRDRFRKLWKKHPILLYKKLKAFLSLWKEGGYDALVDLSLGREAGFFAWTLGIRERIGFDYRGRGFFLTKKIHLEAYEGRPVADIQSDLLSLLGKHRPAEIAMPSLRVPESALIAAARFLKQKGFGEPCFLLGVAPGGGRSWGPNAVYKQWDPARFAQSADSVAAACGGKTILFGDRAEETLLREVASRMRTPAAAASALSLEETAALLLKTKVLLGNDGGLIHLANALGVPTVSLFGPVDEKVYGPYGGPARKAMVTEAVFCRPCYRRFHFPECRHSRQCLDQLSVKKVVEVVHEMAYNC